MFYEQFKYLCEQHKTTPTAVLKEIGLKKSNATNWKNGAMPSIEVLIKLSEYFDVLVDYLIKGTGNTKITPKLSVEEQNILKAYRKADESEKRILEEISEGILKKENKGKEQGYTA